MAVAIKPNVNVDHIDEKVIAHGERRRIIECETKYAFHNEA